jgi:hypothetical protein
VQRLSPAHNLKTLAHLPAPQLRPSWSK